MQEYFAILQKKHHLPVQQFVIYLGEKSPDFRTQLTEQEIFKGFELKNLQELSYDTLLDSEIPEEILMAVLCDFGKEDPVLVLKKIIHKLQKLSKDEISLRKYIRQMAILARLRNLTQLTYKELKTMAWEYDIEKDIFYLDGLDKGEKIGIEKGKQMGIELIKAEQEKKDFEAVRQLLVRNFPDQDIMGILQVDQDFVNRVKASLASN